MFKRRWFLVPSANQDKAYLFPSSRNKIEQKNTNYKGFRQSSLSAVWASLITTEEMALCVEQILSQHFHLGMKQCERLLSEPRRYPSACGKQAETSPVPNTYRNSSVCWNMINSENKSMHRSWCVSKHVYIVAGFGIYSASRPLWWTRIRSFISNN